MATNKRVYYPIHAVGFAPLGTPLGVSGYRAAKGVQSVGFTTNFNLEQVFQLGQLELYENIENIPNIEITLSKVIDGKSLLQHLATPSATASTLAGRYNDNRCMVAVAYYPITLDFSSGTPLSTVVMSGAYVSSLGFDLVVDGNFTENVTLVCNDKTWSVPAGSPFTTGTLFNGLESPVLASGGVQRRENVNMTLSRWPIDIPGISGVAGSGVNPVAANGDLGAHIQRVSISTSLGRTDLFELGRRGPYFRYAEFPTEVTCSIEVTADEFGDSVDASQELENLTDQRIYIVLDQNVTIDLGMKNKLSSVETTGGDTGGGNVVTTYNYSNFNTFKVLNPSADPAGLAS